MSVEGIPNSNFINPVNKGSHAPEFKETEKGKQKAERVTDEEDRKAREQEEKDAERCYEEEETAYYENGKGRYIDEVA